MRSSLHPDHPVHLLHAAMLRCSELCHPSELRHSIELHSIQDRLTLGSRSTDIFALLTENNICFRKRTPFRKRIPAARLL